MGKLLNLTGKTFGRLLVLDEPYKILNKKTYWHCICTCGSNISKWVSKDNLIYKHVNSCGCLRTENTKKQNINRRKKCTYDLTGNYGIGYTQKGEEFYFDLDDYDNIKDYGWNKDADGYLRYYKYGENDMLILMHRLIMNCPKDKEVDHINRNRFDNRKINLRIVNDQQNTMNHSLYKSNTSGICGVSWDSDANKWLAYIGYKNKLIKLGKFSDFNEAVKVRKEAEIEYFKEYNPNLNI